MTQPQHVSKNLSAKISSGKLTYGERAKLCNNPIAKKLFTIIEEKKSNLSVAADVTTKTALLALADMLGPFICMLKTHIDIIEDFDEDLVVQLKALAQKHNFVLFEDRKFADIGNTVQKQYAGGIYNIADWADIINAHTLPGPGIIEGLKKIGAPKGRGLLLLAQMSPKDNLLSTEYTKKTVEMANDDFVIGFIAQEKLSEDPRLLHCMPGVKLQSGTDQLGQQYLTPQKAIERGADIIIVGRGIYQADDPLEMAVRYRNAAWHVYENKLS